MIRSEISERGGLGTQQRAKKSQSLFIPLSLSLSLADRPCCQHNCREAERGNGRRESDGLDAA
jgi:hypothetical protein